MSLLICPECGTENPPGAEICLACQASLVDFSPTKPGDLEQSDQDEKDLLPQADEDLTGLLHSLKQDDDLGELPAAEGEGLQDSPLGSDDSEGQEDSGDEADLPEWLHRIRNRAQTEEDSIGEITQRIRAARDSLDDEKQGGQHRQFESMIDKIHGGDGEQPAGDTAPVEAEQPDTTGEDESEETDWLTRIRKKHRPESTEDISERKGDSLLQWLVALEEDEVVSEVDSKEEGEAKPGTTAEDTQEVHVSLKSGDSTQKIAVREAKSTQRQLSELAVSRAEQIRADQLAATIIDERAPRPVRQRQRGFSPWGIRLVMGLLLVAVVSFALFLPAPVELPPALQGPHSLAVLDWAQGLPEDATILFVSDFQAGYSAEIGMIAKPIMETIIRDDRDVVVLASTASGGFLFYRLLEEAAVDDRLEVRDLGYYPVESFGAFGLANHILSGWRIRSQPTFVKNLPSEAFDGVLILADDYEGAMAWVEQLSSLVPETPIHLIVTAQAAPMLLPYWESGQVMGIVAGMPDAVNLAGDTADLTSRWRAYQAGLLLVIVLLLIGLNFPMQPLNDEEGWEQR